MTALVAETNNNILTETKVLKEIEEVKEANENSKELENDIFDAVKQLSKETRPAFIDKDKTIKNGREECNNYRSYIEVYLRNKELAAGGYLSGTSYDDVPSSGSSGKSPDSKFVGYIISAEKKKPLIEFDKLINAVSQIDKNCGKYLYYTYYENMKPKDINAVLNLKNRYEGYRILNKAYFIVGCLADEVAMVVR